MLVGHKKIDFNPLHLNRYKYVSYRRDDILLRHFMEKAFGKKSVKDLKISLSVNSHDVIKKCLQQEKAIAIMPLSSVQDDLENKKLKLLSEKKFSYTIPIVTLDQKFIEKRKEAFKNFLLKELK